MRGGRGKGALRFAKDECRMDGHELFRVTRDALFAVGGGGQVEQVAKGAPEKRIAGIS